MHVSDKDLDNRDEHAWNAEVSVATGDGPHSERNHGNVKPSLHICTKHSNYSVSEDYVHTRPSGEPWWAESGSNQVKLTPC